MATPKASKEPIGVQAWTRGLQTYIRARPSVETPPVAKVARHTPLFVWGKYNGWYRVETHDHIFGWVKADYVNAPDLDKVAPMSQAKADAASDRTGHQIMFGTPAELKDYYAAYGAEGARKGLALHGVYLASKNSAKVQIAARKKQIHLADASKASTQKRAPKVERFAANAPAKNVAPRLAPRSVETNEALPQITSLPTLVSPIPAGEMRSLAPASSDRVVAPALPVAPMRVAAIAPAPKPAAKNAPRKLTRWELRRQKQLAAKKKKWAKLRSNSGFVSRPQPAMPVVPAPVAVKPVAPISPRDLMKARESFLQQRENRNQNNTPLSPIGEVAPLPDAPSVAAPDAVLTPSSLSKEKLVPGTVISVSYPTQQKASSKSAPHISWVDERGQIVSAPMPPLPKGSANTGLAAIDAQTLEPFIVSSAQLTPKTATAPVSGSRGGSMLDRYRKSSNDFGQGVTKQALSYRGMPYIFGASNPRRGFDCSGFVYYLLRSRGMNPPRTAAGYARYGQSVSKSDLQAGDLVLFANTYKRGISHIGIYMGNNKFVHAASTGKGVRVDSLTGGYFGKKYHSARRVK